MDWDMLVLNETPRNWRKLVLLWRWPISCGGNRKKTKQAARAGSWSWHLPVEADVYKSRLGTNQLLMVYVALSWWRATTRVLLRTQCAHRSESIWLKCRLWLRSCGWDLRGHFNKLLGDAMGAAGLWATLWVQWPQKCSESSVANVRHSHYFGNLFSVFLAHTFKDSCGSSRAAGNVSFGFPYWEKLLRSEHKLTPSHWELRFQCMNLWGTQTFRP